MADEIKGTDLFDEGSIAKTADNIIFYLQSVNNELKEAVKIAKGELKGALSDLNKNKFDNSANIANAAKAQEAANKAKIQAITLAEKQLKSEQLLDKMIAQEATNKQKLAKASADANNVYKQESKQLNELRDRYKNLAAQGKENTKTAKLLKEEVDRLDKKLKDIDSSVGQNTRHVGDYKGQLKELLKEMQQLEPGSDAFIKASQKAGILKDKIKDANEAMQDMASGSKFEQAGNTFGRITDDIKNLDFEGAGEKAKRFGVIMNSISFKEMLAGIKSFGSALMNLGTTLLANPFVALVASIAAVGYEIYRVVDAFRMINVSTETTRETAKKVGDELESLAGKYEEYVIRIKTATGLLTEAQAAEANARLQNANKRRQINKDLATDLKKLAEELGTDINGNPKAGFFGTVAKVSGLGYLAESEREKAIQERFLKEKAKLTAQYGATIIANEKTFEEELKAMRAEEKKKQDDEQKEKLKKLHEDYLARLAEEESYRRKLRDLIITNIEDAQIEEQTRLTEDYQREIDDTNKKVKNKKDRDDILKQLHIKWVNEMKAIDEKYRKEEEDKQKQQLANAKKYADDKFKDLQTEDDAELLAQQNRNKIEAEQFKQKQKEEEERLKKRQEMLAEYTNKAIDLAAKEIKETQNQRIQAIDKDIQLREKNIQRQQELAANGQANTLAFENEMLAQDQLKKEQLRKKQIKTEKELAMLKLIAGYAEKDPNTALKKALIDIALEGAIAAAFYEGSENVGKNDAIYDRGTARDPFLAWVHPGERILTAQQNAQIPFGMSNDELTGLASGRLLPDMGLPLASSFATNVSNSLQLQQMVNPLVDELREVKAAIKQIPGVNISWDDQGRLIETTVKDGMKKVIKHVNSKPRI